MMKFQLAPCQRPPSSIVMKRFILAVIFLRRDGVSQATMPTTAANDSTPTPTQMLPESHTPSAAKTSIQKYVPKVALRLPPRGMYR